MVAREVELDEAAGRRLENHPPRRVGMAEAISPSRVEDPFDCEYGEFGCGSGPVEMDETGRGGTFALVRREGGPAGVERCRRLVDFVAEGGGSTMIIGSDTFAAEEVVEMDVGEPGR